MINVDYECDKYMINVVLDNIIFSLQKAGGISIYWFELIKIIRNRYVVTFYENENINIFRKKIKLNVCKESLLSNRIIRYLPFLKKIPEKSIFHSSYYRVSLQKNVVNITTVHDFTYEYYGKGLAKLIHHWQKHFAINNSDGIICVSENTKRDLIKFFPKIDEVKIKVIYNGVSNDFFPLENKEGLLEKSFYKLITKKYVVFVGDRAEYKNFSLVLDAVRSNKFLDLVVVGGKCFSDTEKKEINVLEERVHHFVGISSRDLNILYNNAYCLVYPSSYEGFGIPVIEAMKSGCPVITTRYSSIPEVAGEAGIYIENLSPADINEKLLLIDNISIRNNFIELGFLQAEKFSWENSANETFAFYDKIHRKKFVKCDNKI